MQYFNGCVYAAGAKKADKEIDAPSEDELKLVQEKEHQQLMSFDQYHHFVIKENEILKLNRSN